jgi:hypothetical protein
LPAGRQVFRITVLFPYEESKSDKFKTTIVASLREIDNHLVKKDLFEDTPKLPNASRLLIL